jgi:LmbE family N-acetylglucosaminyl deacetylase
MHRLSFDKIRRVLCLGAHSDDIEIGCGGTMLQLVRDHRDLEVLWVVFSAAGARRAEACRSASLFLAGASRPGVAINEFRDGFFPSLTEPIKEYFEDLKGYEPDVIFTHTTDDRHQDHRVISEMTWSTFRNHWILEYEVVKYDGDLGRPNIYVPLSADDVSAKVKYLMDAFDTQSTRDWFTPDTFRAITRLRGLECRADSGHAEAFVGRKIVVESNSTHPTLNHSSNLK